MFLFYVNVSRMHPRSCFSSQPLTIPATWVFLRVVWSIILIPPYVTASRFLAGNRDVELKPPSFSSLLFPCFPVFPLLLTPQRRAVYPHIIHPWRLSPRGNKESELNPTTFSSLLLFRVLLSFPYSKPPRDVVPLSSDCLGTP